MTEAAAGTARRTALAEHAAPLVDFRLVAFITVVALAAVAVALTAGGDPPLGAPVPWAALPALGLLLVAAEYLLVRFRYRGEVNGINLMEAVLAPLIVAFPAAPAVATVAVAQVIAAAARRNAPLKASFNIAQWSLAAGVALHVTGVAAPDAGPVALAAAVVAALAAVGLINQATFIAVLAVANRQPIRTVTAGLRPVMVTGWLGGWVLNSATGVLFVLAFATHPLAVLLFPVPLVVLHFAYRGYAGARTDRIRLTGLHQAARLLAEPLDPTDAIPAFLAEVGRSFEARMAVLVLGSGDHLAVHEVDVATRVHRVRDGVKPPAAAVAMAELDAPMRVVTSRPGTLRAFLGAMGGRDALVAPLLEGSERLGTLAVVDQAGLEGFEAGELAVLGALARETSVALVKGRLLREVLTERQTTSEIISATSDGIFTIDGDGIICTWNAAIEQIVGVPAATAIGQSVSMAMQPATAAGEPLDLGRWRHGIALPSQIRVVASDGTPRRLSCSFGRTSSNGSGRLVVIARDLTAVDRFAELRVEVGRLAEAEATQRAVVEQLHQALLPEPVTVAGADFGVAHIPSELHAPTGGDLYDWQVLPDGSVHVAVTDVMGHGLPATKHAMAVISTLRFLAFQGCPLAEVVAQADELLAAGGADVVATVVVARYDPATGRAQVAAGGHPPPLFVSPSTGVSELAAPGCAIGWPGSGSETVADVTLEPGDSLVLYTDGLIEARRDIVQGLEALSVHASAVADRSAEAFAAELLRRALEGAERADDSLAVVIRRVVITTEDRESSWRLSSAADVGAVRRDMRNWLASAGMPPPVADDALAAVSELLANGVRAARQLVTARLAVAADALVLEVADDGPGDAALDDLGRAEPSLDKTDGRGLFIVRTLADSVTITSSPEGTVVRAALTLPECQPRSLGSDTGPSCVDTAS